MIFQASMTKLINILSITLIFCPYSVITGMNLPFQGEAVDQQRNIPVSLIINAETNNIPDFKVYYKAL